MLKAEFFLRDQRVFEPVDLIEDPAVSVVLPTFRRGDGGLLGRAIRSVLEQSFDRLELIVVDDGSTDSTAEVVAALQKNEPRLRYVRHDLNSGLPALRVNEGVSLARAPLIAYQFDDDMWPGDGLQTLVEAAAACSEPSVVYGQCLYREGDYEHLLGVQVTPYLLSLWNRFANNAVLHPREFHRLYGGYDQHIAMRRLCDWDLWLRWISKAPFVFVEHPVSIVDARQPGSIGATVPYDIPLFRAVTGEDRAARLSLDRVFEQQVDAPFAPALHAPAIRASAERQVDEYYARRRDVETAAGGAPAKGTTVSVVSHVFDTSVDITFLNHREAGPDVVQLTPFSELSPERQPEGAAVAFVRTFLPDADVVMASFGQSSTATIYALDDDLPNFFEMDPTLWYLEPTDPHYAAMVDSIARADVGFAYSPLIARTMAQWNPRLVQQSTNILAKWLPESPRSPSKGPLKIAFAGSGARAEEFGVLWPAIVRLSERYRKRVEFTFWGLTPDGADDLPSTVHTLPYTTGYEAYLRRLTAAGFDVMLAPLFEQWGAKRAKCPIKLLEIAAAGAVGVYSDARPYAVVEDGVDGLKAADTPDAWFDALSRLVEMPPEARAGMAAAALAKVRRDFTTEALTPQFQAGLAAARFHRATRRARGPDGRPAVALLAGGAATRRERRTLEATAALLARHGVRAVLMSSKAPSVRDPGVEHVPLSREQVRDPAAVAQAVDRHGCSLLHSVGAHSVGEKGGRLARVPVVVSAGLEAPPAPEVDVVDADLVIARTRGVAGTWIDRVGTPAVAAADPIAPEAFARLERLPPEGATLRVAVLGEVREGFGQLEAIRALARLKDVATPLELLFSDAGDADDLALCREEARRLKVLRRCRFGEDLTRAVHDAVLFPRSELDPAEVLARMAAGTLVIGYTFGPAGEVLGEATGVALDAPEVLAMARSLRRYAALGAEERARRRALAWSAARAEASEAAIARILLDGYADLYDRFESRRVGALAVLAGTATPPVAGEEIRSLDDIHARLDGRLTTVNASLSRRAGEISDELERIRTAGSAETAERLTAQMQALSAEVNAHAATVAASTAAAATSAGERHATQEADLARLRAEADAMAARLATLAEQASGTTEVVRRTAAAVRTSADAAYLDQALGALAREKINRERNRVRPLAILQSWNARRRDLTPLICASWFADWLGDPANARAPGERIQLERFWRAGESDTFDLVPSGEGLHGVDLAAWLFLPPASPKAILRFEVLDATGAVLREGECEAEPNTGREAARLRFPPITEATPSRVRLTALPEAESVGLKFYEIRRIVPLTHGVRRRRLLQRTYA